MKVLINEYKETRVTSFFPNLTGFVNRNLETLTALASQTIANPIIKLLYLHSK